MIAERNTAMAPEKDHIIQILERAQLDLDDACTNMDVALEEVPDDVGLLSDLSKFSLELWAIKSRLELHIKYYKRLAKETAA